MFVRASTAATTVGAEASGADSPSLKQGLRSVPIGLPGVGWTAILATITVAGVLVRLPSFGDSLFGDEVSAYFIVTGHSLGQVLHILSGHGVDLNPPAYFVLAWVSEHVFGQSSQSLKLVSLLAGTAAIPLTFLLGRRLVNLTTGLVASVLVAFSPYLIYFSTEARPYALLMVLLLGSTLALLRALETGRTGWWGAYTVLSCAAMYTHYTSVFILGAQFLWALATRPAAWRALLVATAAAALAYLPWLPSLIRDTHSPGVATGAFWVPFNATTIRTILGNSAIGNEFLPLSSVPGWAGIALILAGCLAGLGGVLARGRLPRVSAQQALVPILALAMPVGLIVYSLFRDTIFDERNLISSWPWFAIATAAVVTYARGVWRTVAICFGVAGFALGGLEMVSVNNRRPDYAAAAIYIDRTGPRGAPVVDLPAPMPGPPTALEVAMDLEGVTPHHPVTRMGLPPLQAVVSAPPYTPLSAPTDAAVAREATTRASHGSLFLVVPFSLPIPELQKLRRGQTSGIDRLGIDRVRTFLAALPARFRIARTRAFPGFIHITVIEYQS